VAKIPDELKQTDGLKSVRADIKRRQLRLSREDHVEYKHIVLERDYPFATLRIRRADDEGNSLDVEAVKDLRDSLTELADDPNIKVLFVTGNDRVFSVGADVKKIKDLTPWEVRDLVRRGKAVFQRLEEMDCVTIALINGLALGGGLELAMCCDFRIASPKARFGLVEAKIGIVPGWGGTQRLPRIIGMARALEMVYTGETIKSDEALKLGLIQRIIEKGQDIEEEGRKYAEKFVKLSKISLMLGKRAVRTGFEMPLIYGNALESELFTLAWASKDREEGFNAFLEKRKPDFKDE
jgi:enoyl-CoA hydratase